MPKSRAAGGSGTAGARVASIAPVLPVPVPVQALVVPVLQLRTSPRTKRSEAVRRSLISNPAAVMEENELGHRGPDLRSAASRIEHS